MTDPNLLVGFDTADDAAVYQVSGEMAIIQTADFFPPMVDDPYLFGAIAAANAFSDVYAMGGKPGLALNLLCVNPCLGNEVVREILRGGADQAIRAGCIISGGHTIEDKVPKYGLSVTGFVRPDRVLRNVGARPGDVLILTKPLGSGILLTALKAGFINESDGTELFARMAELNKDAAEVMEDFHVHACTDITGFGLLGHLCEMASGSGVTLLVEAARLPLFGGAKEMSEMGMVPEGAYRNLDYIRPKVSISETVEQSLVDIASDPQTSGGLCIAVPENEAGEMVQRLDARGVTGVRIGTVRPLGEKYIELI